MREENLHFMQLNTQINNMYYDRRKLWVCFRRFYDNYLKLILRIRILDPKLFYVMH